MRLSEAMRLGAMMTRPLQRQFVTFENWKPVSACALGAAAVALTTSADAGTLAEILSAAWPWIGAPGRPVACPVCTRNGWRVGNKYPTHGSVIVHLNDDHLLSREAIADLMAEVEPKEMTDEDVDRGEGSRGRTIDQGGAGGSDGACVRGGDGCAVAVGRR